MKTILQSVKSGFSNIKEIFEIFLSDNDNNEGYDLYINSSDQDIAKTAKLLQILEPEQEQKRFSLFSTNKDSKKEIKKNFKPLTSVPKTSQKGISNDALNIEGMEPDK